jgi:hypothetical protein
LFGVSLIRSPGTAGDLLGIVSRASTARRWRNGLSVPRSPSVELSKTLHLLPVVMFVYPILCQSTKHINSLGFWLVPFCIGKKLVWPVTVGKMILAADHSNSLVVFPIFPGVLHFSCSFVQNVSILWESALNSKSAGALQERGCCKPAQQSSQALPKLLKSVRFCPGLPGHMPKIYEQKTNVSPCTAQKALAACGAVK